MRAPAHPKELSSSDQIVLVLLAQAGDRAALEQLLRNSYVPLRRDLNRLAGFDDIFQETSIHISVSPRSGASLRSSNFATPLTFEFLSSLIFMIARLHSRKCRPQARLLLLNPFA